MYNLILYECSSSDFYHNKLYLFIYLSYTPILLFNKACASKFQRESAN